MRSSLLAAGHVHNCCAAASLRSPHVTHAHQHARLAQSRRPHHQHHTTNTMSAAASGDSQPTTTTTHMLASFSSEEDRAAFTAKFKLFEGGAAEGVQLQYQAAASDSWLDSAAVFKHLSSRRMGRALLSTPSIPSTQEFMRQHTSVLPDGAVLVADQQTKGKGRGGNVWTSPAGCLMFTALRQLQVQGTQAAFINYVVCLAVVQGIREATQHLLPGGLEVQIKWPNDIYYSGVKIGGALIHTTFAGTQQFCVLTGIGLNVSNSQPTTCLDDIIQARLQQQQGQQSQQQQPARVCKEQLLASVLSHLEACFDTFQSQGFDPLQPLYLSAWMHSNQVVELEEGGGDGGGVGQSGQRVRLTLVGLSPHGFLLGKDAQGAEYELTPDGNSFDMMQGLIKRKL